MTEAELAAELARLDAALADLYRERRPILEALAEARGPYELPKRRYQTDTQAKVQRCPRCGGRLEDPPDLARLGKEKAAP